MGSGRRVDEVQELIVTHLAIQVMRSESMRLNHERSKMMEQIKDNTEKIKNNKQLPYLVGNVVEVR